MHSFMIGARTPLEYSSSRSVNPVLPRETAGRTRLEGLGMSYLSIAGHLHRMQPRQHMVPVAKTCTEELVNPVRLSGSGKDQRLRQLQAHTPLRLSRIICHANSGRVASVFAFDDVRSTWWARASPSSPAYETFWPSSSRAERSELPVGRPPQPGACCTTKKAGIVVSRNSRPGIKVRLLVH